MHYDVNLVALSVLVAIVASHAALGMQEVFSHASSRFMRCIPPCVFGTGIWAMHFLGMLACRESIPVHYHLGLTVASFLLAILSSQFTFSIIRTTRPGIPGLLLQSLLLSLGISAMHYTGMHALLVAPPIAYDSLWVALSLGVSFGAALVALLIGHGRIDWSRLTAPIRSLLAAFVLGLAISASHYTAMAGVEIPTGGFTPLATPGLTLDINTVGFTVLLAAIFIVIANLASMLLQQRLSPLRILKTVAVGEASMMLVFPMIPSMPPVTEAILATAVLLLLVSPLAWRLQRQEGTLQEEKQRTQSQLHGQQVMNRLLTKPLANLSLKDMLDECLEMILDLPWMPLKPQGGIFLYRPERQRLELFVQHDMHPALLTLCKEVAIGQCLCGLAALKRELVHASCVDERHTTQYPHMSPHGHYNVPLLLEKELMGVLVLYLEPGHQPIEEEINFLDGLGSTLALLIDRWRKIRTIHQMAFYDPLTELPNRVLLKDRFRTAVARSRRGGLRMALLFLDLDNFKQINDTLGHTTGDHLLQKVTEQLRQVVRSTDTIARLGGDEFILLLEQLEGNEEQVRKEVETICRKLLQSLSLPIPIWGNTFNVTGSIGVAFFPEHGESLEPLLQAADTAMYEAKRRGRNCRFFYNNNLHVQLTNTLSIKRELPYALEKGQLHLFYQPQFDIRSGFLTGAEVLLRWNHPQRGFIPPGTFIPIAESDGFIIQLGEWLLHQACLQKQQWHQAGLGGAYRLAVNVSLVQLIHEGETSLIAHTLERTLADTELQPGEIELELTESLFAHQEHPVLKNNIEYLKKLGVSLAIDDFGTGHSSLGRLKLFPIDVIKIDRLFVRDLMSDPNDEAIVRAVTALGHTLDMEVLAEGVETEEQLHLLREIGCDTVQGFLTGRPMPPEEFEQILRTRERRWPMNGGGVQG